MMPRGPCGKSYVTLGVVVGINKGCKVLSNEVKCNRYSLEMGQIPRYTEHIFVLTNINEQIQISQGSVATSLR